MKRQAVLDLVGLLGLALLVEGARRIYPPAALLVAGVFLELLAVLGSRR